MQPVSRDTDGSAAVSQGLRQCIDAVSTAADMSVPLEELRTWAERLRAANCQPTDDEQTRLCDVLWEAFDAPQPHVAPVARKLFVELLAPMPHEDAALPPKCCLLALLLSRSRAAPWRKRSLVTLECLFDAYGPAFLLDEALMGPDACVSSYSGLVHAPTGFESSSRRRARLALALLQEDARRRGLKHDKGKLVDGAQEWTRWCANWVSRLALALRSGNARQRAMLCAYHVTDLCAYSHAALHALLQELCTGPSSSADPQAQLRSPAVVGVLKVGKELGLVNAAADGSAIELGAAFDPVADADCTVRVPDALVAMWLETAHQEVQISTMGMIIAARQSTTPFTKPELDAATKYLRATLAGLSADSRSAARTAIVHLLARLRASAFASSRLLENKAKKLDAAQKARHAAAVADAEGFLQDVSQMVRSALRPDAAFAVATQALTYLEALLDAGVDKRTSWTPGRGKLDRFPFDVQLLDADVADRLLLLAQSTFEALSERALRLLKRFPTPLPGLETPAQIEERILKPAQRLLLSTKEFEANSAAVLLDLHQHISGSQAGGSPAQSVLGRSIASLLSGLEACVVAGESGNMREVAVSHPIHGHLVALQRAFGKTRDEAVPNEELRALARQALALIDRIWQVVSPVLCSAAPEGNLGEVDERARAMAQLDLDDEAEGNPDSVDVGYQEILSYSWRGIKEASSLVSAIAASAFQAGPDVAPTPEETETLGQRFITWLLSVRHRGAFSTIYPAFGATCATIVRKGDAAQREMPRKWLDSFLSSIAGSTGALTITRRSAGLAYSVVALLGAHPDNAIREETVRRLISICEHDQADTQSTAKTAQIHALNTLRYVVADGGLAEACKPFLSDLLRLAISRFSSPLWSVRNAALMLFSATCTRIFGAQVLNQRADSPLNFRHYLASFEGLNDFFTRELQKGSDGGVEGWDTRAFAILMFLSKIKATEMQDLEAIEALGQVIEACLASPLWKIRETAADALATLLPANKNGKTAARLAGLPSGEPNLMHGRWLAVRRLLQAGAKDDDSFIAEAAQRVQASDSLPEHVRHLASACLQALADQKSPGPKSNGAAVGSGDLPSLIDEVDSEQNVVKRDKALVRLGEGIAAGGNGAQYELAALQRIAAASDEHQPEPTRAAALAALELVPHHHFETATHILKAGALLNLLQDDDEAIREHAARFAVKYLASARKSNEQVSAGLQILFDEAAMLGYSPSQCVDMLYDRLDASQQSRAPWSAFLVSRLLLEQDEIEEQTRLAFPTAARLFAEERPNIYKDRVAEIRRLLLSAARLRIFDSESVRARSAAILDNLSNLLASLRSPTVKANANEAALLGTQLVAAAALAVASGASNAAALVQAMTEVRDLLPIELDTSQLAGPPSKAPEGPRHRIAMISDFFFPNVGGVEGHIYMVSQRLLARGHKVIVITHAYDPDRVGVRYLAHGLKVYYVPYGVIARQDTLPNFLSLMGPLRTILIRERIQIVHAHQALSSMGHEGITHAKTMGLKAVFTDHSLFGFADAAAIMTNKLLRFALSDIDHVVCVSHVGKENTVLRAHLDPSMVSCIPNAVVASSFLPDPDASSGGPLTIVVLSRLMYRKGIDLLIAAIPRICSLHPDVHFLIGGDGPKRVELEQMRERYFLQDRVELVGAVPQSRVREHLIRGQIFLNTSLTEAFGTSVIEAASCGLFIVSTRVGGVPEVLPSWMVELAAPHEDDVVRATLRAIAALRSKGSSAADGAGRDGAHDAWRYHEAVKHMYSWADVARRLEAVYDRVLAREAAGPVERLRKYYSCGPIAGVIFCIIVVVGMLQLRALEWCLPADEIDRAVDVRQQRRRSDEEGD